MEENKTKLLYAVGLGLLLSDIIPTPADAVYFSYERSNKQKLEQKVITPKQYWIRDAIGYYGFNSVWWGAILLASIYIGKDYTQKRNLMIGLIAGGAVFAVIKKNIQKDEAFYQTQNLTVAKV